MNTTPRPIHWINLESPDVGPLSTPSRSLQQETYLMKDHKAYRDEKDTIEVNRQQVVQDIGNLLARRWLEQQARRAAKLPENQSRPKTRK